jgi:transposase
VNNSESPVRRIVNSSVEAIMSKRRQSVSGLPVVQPRAGAIDIGSRFHVVAVPPDLCDEPVQTFQAFTGDLQRMATWLKANDIVTVAMESTGVYWVPVFEMLESHGIEAVLCNARDARMVPGRKSDVNDAQWLQRLHACGLLRASFRPVREIAALREYLRLRENHVQDAAAHIQHMQKALTYMNLQLQHVVSDINGLTGMRIIRAILAGERDPKALATMRDVRCHSKIETIEAALVGNYQPEHLFALKQAVALYDFYQEQIQQCDREIELNLIRLSAQKSAPTEPPPKPRRRGKQSNALDFDVQPLLYQLLGIDITQIHGLGPYVSLRMIAECGTDLSRWPSAKHFTSWLSLAPGCKISGGKVLSAHTRKTGNRLTSILRMAAVTVGKTNTALGAFYRRLGARVGKAKAVTATARKIAVLFYNAMRFGMKYVDPGADSYEAHYRERVVKQLHRRAAQFGFKLQSVEAVS